MKSRIIRLILLLSAAFVLFIATRQYLGYHYLSKYKSLRTEVKSIESGFAALEGALKKAVRFSNNPVFYQELGRLYLERAMAEIKFGTAEKREFYLDCANDVFAAEINRNPIDAWAYYDMARVWMLYNFPLLTYAEKGRFYCRKVLEFNPANEFLNLNILCAYLTQWNDLSDEEKSFSFKQLEKMVRDKENFLEQLRRRWMENVKDEGKLKEILMGDKILWDKVKGSFN